MGHMVAGVEEILGIYGHGYWRVKTSIIQSCMSIAAIRGNKKISTIERCPYKETFSNKNESN